VTCPRVGSHLQCPNWYHAVNVCCTDMSFAAPHRLIQDYVTVMYCPRHSFRLYFTTPQLPGLGDKCGGACMQLNSKTQCMPSYVCCLLVITLCMLAVRCSAGW
jgi:hypothetical protein